MVEQNRKLRRGRHVTMKEGALCGEPGLEDWSKEDSHTGKSVRHLDARPTAGEEEVTNWPRVRRHLEELGHRKKEEANEWPKEDRRVEQPLRQLSERVAVEELAELVNLSKKSIRALRAEVVKLQAELKAEMRCNETTLTREREARQDLEMRFQVNSAALVACVDNVKRLSDKYSKDSTTMAALLSHVKNIEQACVLTQQDVQLKQDLHSTRLSELHESIDDLRKRQDKDMKELKLLEQTYQHSLSLIDSRLEQEKAKYDTIAQALSERLDELEKSNAEKYDTLARELVDRLEELEKNKNLERQGQLRSELSEMLEIRENSWRDELMKIKEQLVKTTTMANNNRQTSDAYNSTRGLADLHKTVAEQVATTDPEEDIETRLKEINKIAEKELEDLKEQMRIERKRTSKHLHSLHHSAHLLDQQMGEHKKQQNRLFLGEVHARKEYEERWQRKIRELQEALSLATITLQQAIGGIEERFREEMSKERRRIQEQCLTVRNDLELKLNQVKGQVQTSLDDNNRKDYVILRGLEEKYNSLQSQMNVQLKDGADKRSNELESIKTLLSNKAENANDRWLTNPVDLTTAGKPKIFPTNITPNLERSTTDTNFSAEDNFKEMRESIQRLADTMQLLKVLVALKFQSEQKIREEEIHRLEVELEKKYIKLWKAHGTMHN